MSFDAAEEINADKMQEGFGDSISQRTVEKERWLFTILRNTDLALLILCQVFAYT